MRIILFKHKDGTFRTYPHILISFKNAQEAGAWLKAKGAVQVAWSDPWLEPLEGSYEIALTCASCGSKETLGVAYDGRILCLSCAEGEGT